MLSEQEGRDLAAKIQQSIPEDCKFQLILARADVESGVEFLRLTELPKDGANYMLREFLERKTADAINDFERAEETPDE